MILDRLTRFVLLFLVAASAVAQEPKRPPEMQALVDQARALPPEFAADILLRLANSWMLDELSRSANPIVALYAKIETLLGPAPPLNSLTPVRRKARRSVP